MYGNITSHLSKRKENNDRDIGRWEMDILPDSINNIAITRTEIIIPIKDCANETWNNDKTKRNKLLKWKKRVKSNLK